MTARLESDRPLQIGTILTDARRRQGIDIETVERETKIRAKYLLALENEEWDVLPGPAYVRGFIRSYADLLGIDGEVLVDEYRRRRHAEPATGPGGLGEPVLRERRVLDDRRRRSVWRWLILAAIVVGIAIALLIVGITDGGEQGDGRRGERSGQGKGGEQGQRGKREGRDAGGGSDKQSDRNVPDKVTVKLVARSDLGACLVNNHREVLVPDQLLTAGTEESVDHGSRSEGWFLSMSPAALTSRMTSGARARRVSIDGCTDSRPTSANTFFPPAMSSMSLRKPTPPLA